MGVERYGMILLRHTGVTIKELSTSYFAECMKRLVHLEALIISLLDHSNIAVFLVA